MGAGAGSRSSAARSPSAAKAARSSRNTTLVFDRDGALVAVYRKIHLFDVDVGGRSYRESDAEEPGRRARRRARSTDWTIGLTVCYDVRFPELYRILALEGAELVTVPAHFTTPTGKDHWHVLLRARADREPVLRRRRGADRRDDGRDKPATAGR